MKFNEGFLAQMREATKLLQTEGPAAATAAIQRALNGAPTSDDSHRSATATDGADAGTGTSRTARTRIRRQLVEDVDFVDIVEPPAGDGRTRETGGRFVSASLATHAGSRNYKLYIPTGYGDEPLPLVIMLHGCTQDPDDFAEGSRMNTLADEGRFLVAYPEQNRSSNPSQCWNWFQPAHQQRGQGEPAILADITREISRTYRVDACRVYIAGMSAGGAMAAVMAATYPELYAAVGIHSGIPYGVARDMPSAFAAMKRSRAKAAAMKAKVGSAATLEAPVPVIVFHGDRDATVHPDNADHLLDQFATGRHRADVDRVVRQGQAPGTRAYTRTTVQDANGRPVAEKWVVHGAGHAWSGGSRRGTYTDPEGPCASREMLRFFMQHRRVPES